MRLQFLIMSGSLALALLAASGALARGAPRATFIKGNVTVVAAGTPDGARLKRNQEVPAGAMVQTGEGARAELTFPDGSVLRVGPASTLKLDGATFKGTSKEVQVEATLVAGQAWAKVTKLAGDDPKFQVRTANAVAGVRGTVFRVNVDRDEATVVKVYNGAVAVAAPLITSAAPGAAPADVNLGGIRPDRRPVAAPFKEVSQKEFEHLLGKMMAIRIARGLSVSEASPTAFTQEEDAQDEPEWVRWNAARDLGRDVEKSD